MPDTTACCTGDAAPAQSPVQVLGLTLTPGASLTFGVTGGVNFEPAPIDDPPDGDAAPTSPPAANGIAAWTNAPANSLIGVFLDASQPDSSAAPSSLDFTVISFASLSPGLKQAFFIGDGRTGNGSGSAQTFIVPPGATRLFLGTADGFGWFNNVGSFSVTIEQTTGVERAPEIPTLSTGGLLALLTLLAGSAAVTLARTRR